MLFSNRKVVEIVIFLALGLIAGLVILFLRRGEAVYQGPWAWRRNNWKTVTSFEECVQAGNPVMESYPERCSTPSGKTFTKQY